VIILKVKLLSRKEFSYSKSIGVKSKLMLKWYSLAILFCTKVYSQNLIYNGGFEEINICELDNNCCPKGWYAASHAAVCPGFLYFKGNPKSNAGKGSIELILYDKKDLKRDYIQSKLICPLVKGIIYDLILYVKPLNGLVEGDIQVAFVEQLIDTVFPGQEYFESELVNGEQKINHFTNAGSVSHLD
jgi:hypothetical protein